MPYNGVSVVVDDFYVGGLNSSDVLVSPSTDAVNVAAFGPSYYPPDPRSGAVRVRVALQQSAVSSSEFLGGQQLGRKLKHSHIPTSYIQGRTHRSCPSDHKTIPVQYPSFILLVLTENCIFLTKLLSAQSISSSIINQAFDSRLRLDARPVNADGFGVVLLGRNLNRLVRPW
ncbi:hypothetical protein VP01_3112g1 [Puccinia sorghi]|uniref:Uncharacterized protein n=1 Tax=Puccinia sorghi TaxID=27349 RepID=A0A0L6V065_9BASI|nr:hypothetical protein VP01_3112g1 [Puccinia sorghi]